MTLWLALETSSRAASIALRCGEARIFRRLATERAHASDLLPALDSLLADVSRAPTDVDGIVVGTGPGSYTGLRVGIATALGLARGTGAALVGVPSIAALAYGELSSGEEAILVSNAHAGALYIARYARTASDLRTLLEPAVAPAEELRTTIDWDHVRILADREAARQLGLSERGGTRLTLDAIPRADALLDLGMRRMATQGASPPEDLQPLYLRPFQAKARRR